MHLSLDAVLYHPHLRRNSLVDLAVILELLRRVRYLCIALSIGGFQSVSLLLYICFT